MTVWTSSRAIIQGTYGLRDVGVHVYINGDGAIEWGRSLERTPEFPRESAADDLVILLHGKVV